MYALHVEKQIASSGQVCGCSVLEEHCLKEYSCNLLLNRNLLCKDLPSLLVCSIDSDHLSISNNSPCRHGDSYSDQYLQKIKLICLSYSYFFPMILCP